MKQLKPKDIETIFYGSRLYGARYDGDRLPHYKWQWPQGTYLQRRLKQLQEAQAKGEHDTA